MTVSHPPAHHQKLQPGSLGVCAAQLWRALYNKVVNTWHTCGAAGAAAQLSTDWANDRPLSTTGCLANRMARPNGAETSRKGKCCAAFSFFHLGRARDVLDSVQLSIANWDKRCNFCVPAVKWGGRRGREKQQQTLGVTTRGDSREGERERGGGEVWRRAPRSWWWCTLTKKGVYGLTHLPIFDHIDTRRQSKVLSRRLSPTSSSLGEKLPKLTKNGDEMTDSFFPARQDRWKMGGILGRKYAESVNMWAEKRQMGNMLEFIIRMGYHFRQKIGKKLAEIGRK